MRYNSSRIVVAVAVVAITTLVFLFKPSDIKHIYLNSPENDVENPSKERTVYVSELTKEHEENEEETEEKLEMNPPIFESNRQKFSEMVLENCEAGHFPAPPPVCGGGGCLQTLEGNPRNLPELSKSTLTILNSLKDPKGNPLLHWDMKAIPLVTAMQWSFGIFGSVGEIGVYDGRLTALMAVNMAPDVGERLFVCDIFGDIKHMKIFTNNAKKQIFEDNMKKVGYSLSHENEKRRIRLWQDSSMYLSKNVLLKMKIPTFRLYSIDGNHHYPFILNDLNHVTCVLRDGGVIVIDDVVKNEWADVTGSVKQYMMFVDTNVVKPLLHLGRKLYLCTASWYPKYWTYLATKRKDLRLCETSNNNFGGNFTYLAECGRK